MTSSDAFLLFFLVKKVYHAICDNGPVAIKIQRFISPIPEDERPERKEAPLRIPSILPHFIWNGIQASPYHFSKDPKFDNITPSEKENRARCLHEMELHQAIKKRCSMPPIVDILLPFTFSDYFVDLIGFDEFYIPVTPVTGERPLLNQTIHNGFNPGDIEYHPNYISKGEDIEFCFVIRALVSVMPLCEGSVDDRIKTANGTGGIPFPLHQRLLCGLQVAQGLTIMHLCGFLHRDIKAANLLMHNKRWKLSDFGISSSFPMTLSSLSSSSSSLCSLDHDMIASHGELIHSSRSIRTQSKGGKHLHLLSSSGPASSPRASSSNECDLPPPSSGKLVGTPISFSSSQFKTLPNGFGARKTTVTTTTTSNSTFTSTSTLHSPFVGGASILMTTQPMASPKEVEPNMLISASSSHIPSHTVNSLLFSNSPSSEQVYTTEKQPTEEPTANDQEDKFVDFTHWSIFLYQLLNLMSDKQFDTWHDNEDISFEHRSLISTSMTDEEFRIESGRNITRLLKEQAMAYPGLPSFIESCIENPKPDFELVQSDIYVTWRAILEPGFPFDYKKLNVEGILTFISNQTDIEDAIFDRTLSMLREMITTSDFAFNRLLQLPLTVSSILNIVYLRFSNQEAMLVNDCLVDAMLIIERCLKHLERKSRYNELRKHQMELKARGHISEFIVDVIRDRKNSEKQKIPLSDSASSSTSSTSSSSVHVFPHDKVDLDGKITRLACQIAMLLCVNNDTFIHMIFAPKVVFPNMRFVIDQIMPDYESFYFLILTLSSAGPYFKEFILHGAGEKRLKFIEDQLSSVLNLDHGLLGDISTARHFSDFLRYFARGAISLILDSEDERPAHWNLTSLRTPFLSKGLPNAWKELMDPISLALLQQKIPDIDWEHVKMTIKTCLPRIFSYRHQNANQSRKDLCLNRLEYNGQYGAVPLLQWAMQVSNEAKFCKCEIPNLPPSSLHRPEFLGQIVCIRCVGSVTITCQTCYQSNVTTILTSAFECHSNLLDRNLLSDSSPNSTQQLQHHHHHNNQQQQPLPTDPFPTCCRWTQPISRHLLPSRNFKTISYRFGKDNKRRVTVGDNQLVTDKSIAWSDPITIKIFSELSRTSPKQDAEQLLGTLEMYVEIKVSKAGSEHEMWLGFTTEAIFAGYEHVELKESRNLNGPYIGYNVKNGHLLYSSMKDPDDPEMGNILISRPYGPPLDCGRRLGLGIAGTGASSRIFFVAGEIVLPRVDLLDLVHFPTEAFKSALSSPMTDGTAAITVTPGCHVELYNYSTGSLLKNNSTNDLGCPFATRGESMEVLSQKFIHLTLLDPSLTYWLSGLEAHYRSHHPNALTGSSFSKSASSSTTHRASSSLVFSSSSSIPQSSTPTSSPFDHISQYQQPEGSTAESTMLDSPDPHITATATLPLPPSYSSLGLASTSYQSPASEQAFYVQNGHMNGETTTNPVLFFDPWANDDFVPEKREAAPTSHLGSPNM
jgi:hypothetical protein